VFIVDELNILLRRRLIANLNPIGLCLHRRCEKSLPARGKDFLIERR
jgi:hypothetical protein